jgi:hypothetical protein
MEVVQNGEVKLLPERILKWLNVCENLTNLVHQWLQKEHETEFQTLDEMKNQWRKWNHNIEARLFYVDLILNRWTSMKIKGDYD